MDWRDELDREVTKAGDHSLATIKDVEAKLGKMERSLRMTSHDDGSDETSARKDLNKLEKDLSEILTKIDDLNNFASHNFSICLQLLKEFEEVGGPHTISEEFRKDLKNRPFHSAMKLTELHERALTLNNDAGVDAVGRAIGHEQKGRREYRVQAFFLGVFSMCLLNLVLLIHTPPINPKFNPDTFAAIIPIFRLSFAGSLLYWTGGLVVKMLDSYGVNYPMILDIDPSISVDSSDIFTLAQFQTLVFVILLQLYLLDFKFCIGFCSPVAWQLYPLVAATINIFGIILPANPVAFLSTARHQLRWSLFNVCFAFLPMCHVTFGDNLLGDVLTSVVKPINDFVYSACYVGLEITRSHVHALDAIDECKKVQTSGYTCIILSIPFFFRLVQCMRRYTDTWDYKHLLNVGKYFTSLLVSIVAWVRWEEKYGLGHMPTMILVVVSYFISTIYSLAWDLCMDWGLFPDFPTSCRLIRQKKMYPNIVYRAFTVADIAGRMTWAFNLMPMSAFLVRTFGERFRLAGEIFVLFVVSAEIVRRGLWTVIRIEHEHVANFSKYREQLWLPLLTDTPAEYHAQLQRSQTTTPKFFGHVDQESKPSFFKRAATSAFPQERGHVGELSSALLASPLAPIEELRHKDSTKLEEYSGCCD